jgi:hypothetical protein
MTRTVDEATRVRTGKNVFAREFEGELVVLDLARGDYYGLDPIGAQLWHGLVAGKCVRDVAQEIAPQYDVDPDRLRSDLVALLQDLVGKGLVEVMDATA